jgi:hypothetical protein
VAGAEALKAGRTTLLPNPGEARRMKQARAALSIRSGRNLTRATHCRRERSTWPRNCAGKFQFCKLDLKNNIGWMRRILRRGRAKLNFAWVFESGHEAQPMPPANRQAAATALVFKGVPGRLVLGLHRPLPTMHRLLLGAHQGRPNLARRTPD